MYTCWHVCECVNFLYKTQMQRNCCCVETKEVIDTISVCQICQKLFQYLITKPYGLHVCS